MTRKNMLAGSAAAVAALFTLLLAGSAGAQRAMAVAEGDIGVEIVRAADELADELRPRPTDAPRIADTVLIFTSLGGEDSRVLCVGFDKSGRVAGRAWTKLPALGLSYILASDISNGRVFIGHVQCGTGPYVRGSALFVGPDVTDLPAVQGLRKKFPVVTHY